MLIGIDGNEANIKNRVGVGQYAFNLLKNLYLLDKKNQYIIYLKNPPLDDFPKENKNWHYKIFGPQKLWTKFALPFCLLTQSEKLNLFYSPSHYSPLISFCPTIPTIHDLGYLQFQSQFTKKDLYQLTNWTKQSIKKAAHIVTVSNFSKIEIKKTYNIDPQKITIAYNGVEQPLKVDIEKEKKVLKNYNLQSKKYYLYLGTLKPNKNIPFLIRSFSQFIKKSKDLNIKTSNILVIAGKKGWLFDEIFTTVKKEGIESNIIFTDFIDESQKWTLYKNASALIMPSLYEGFGIPVIEAMKSKTPVISSNISPLKEVLKNNAFYFNPNNEKELVNEMIKFEKSSSLEIQKTIKSAKIRADYFSWINTAKSVISVFEKFNK